jgi:DNA polymerase-3 subunit alpha
MKDTYKRYKDMIHHEVKVIKDKGYIDYFLVVADLVQYAKDKNIMVGPARGSAGASLVSYLMGITEVDPIEFDLLFERFLDPSRSDPPDIDLDFQDDRRDEVKEYLREKYGVDKVANVAGYTMFHEKSLIDDIGRCYKIPKSNITVYKDSLSINGGDNSITQVISEICGIYPQVPKNIHKILGQLRGLTVHAAGVIVSTKPIGETTTMMQDTIAIDKRDAGYMNLLKIDALSLKTLRVLSLCLERVEMSVKELYKLPLDIPEVLMGFKKGCMGGIFQYAGNTTKKVCMQALEEFKFDNNTKENMKEIFGVITDVNTLSRPASLNNGSTARYIKHDVEVIHPIITEHTQKTRGQIIYQEQIMRALRSAGLDWSDVTAVRKLMTAHEGAEKLSGIRDRFIENLIKMFGNTEEQALYVWRRLGDEGAYGFNAPHCVSYTKIAYYTMYFKIFHKDIFYWANMVVDPSDNLLLKEYIQTGGIVYPVRFGKSKLDWSLSDGQLRAGYITVKGIGVKSAEKLEKLTDPSNIAKGIRQKLEDIHAFDEDPPKPDYLGIGTMVKSLKLVNHRVPLKKVVNSENLLCSVGGRITELHIKSLIEFYKKDGRDWSKEKDAHKDKYVNFRMYDETEEMVCTINRYKYANPAMKLVVSEYETGDVVEIFGEWKKERGKMYISKIVNLTKMSETVL